MKAVIVTKYGGPEVLQVKDVAKPTPKDNELLIKIQASSITTAESMMRQGTPRFARLFLGLTRPKHPIPGTGFAGVVMEVGSKVNGFECGDAVFGETTVSFGTNAEYVCVSPDNIVLPMPDYLSFEEAAVMCDGAITSMNFLKNLANVQAGQKVLINGASGSLGVAAVQIAKRMGAEVTGVCSSANTDLVKSLGADYVIDYKQIDFRKQGKKYDVVYDTVGKTCYGEVRNVLSQKGIYMSPVLTVKLLLQMLFNRKRVKFDATGIKPAKELKELLKELLQIISEGKYNMVVERRYSIDEIVAAHTYVDTGHKRGNIVLSM